MKQKLLADKKKREREVLQRKMAAGVDFLGDGDVKFNKKRQGQSTINKIFEQITNLIDNIKPFKKEIRQIQANYDRSISLFFEIV